MAGRVSNKMSEFSRASNTMSQYASTSMDVETFRYGSMSYPSMLRYQSARLDACEKSLRELRWTIYMLAAVLGVTLALALIAFLT